MDHLRTIYTNLSINSLRSYISLVLERENLNEESISVCGIDNSEYKFEECKDMMDSRRSNLIGICSQDDDFADLLEEGEGEGEEEEEEEEEGDESDESDESEDDSCKDTLMCPEDMKKALIEAYGKGLNHTESNNSSNDRDDEYRITIGMASVPPGASELPHHHATRPEVISQLVKRLRAAKPGNIIVISGAIKSTGSSKATGLTNISTATSPRTNSTSIHLFAGTTNYTSGIGKSTLASAVIRLPEVRLLFGGGIFWIHIGAVTPEFSDLELFRIVHELARRMQLQYTSAICRKKNSNSSSRNPNSLSNSNSHTNLQNQSSSTNSQSFHIPTQGFNYDLLLNPCLQSSALSTLDACCNVIKDLMKVSIQSVYNHQEISEHGNNKTISGTSSISNTSEIPQFLLVLDDVCGDRVVHLFQELGFVLLITTKFPNLFSYGSVVGSLLAIDDIDVDFALEILSRSARMVGTQQLPREAYKLLEVTGNTLELSMLGSMAVERATEPFMWTEIHQKRIAAAAAPVCGWINTYANASWASSEVARHMGVIITTKLSLSGLTASIQDYYLSLVVLPRGISVTRDYLSTLWDITGDYLSAVISLLVMRCLLTAETAVGHTVKYRLHDLQADCLVMHALSMAVKPRRRASRSLQNRLAAVIQISVDRSIAVLTDPALVSAGEDCHDVGGPHTFTFDCACWRRLDLLSDLGLCQKICPAESFQRRIDLQMAACMVGGDMCRYIGYACRVLEDRGHFHPTLVIWYKTALDFLERAHRGDTIEAAGLENSLGLLLQRLGRFCEAVDVHFKAAIILENLYGGRHIDVALTYSNIGLALKALGHVDDAIHMLRKSLFITIETDGVENPTVARTLTNLSHLLAAKGSTCESIAGFEAAVNIFELSLGPNHPESIMTSAERGIALLNAGEVPSGLEMIENAFITLKRYGFGDDDPYIRRLREVLKRHRVREDLCDFGFSSCSMCKS